MDFKDNKPIYLQIVALIGERIASGQWEELQRIPSVRDLGAELGVNPNTCIRAYEQLTREGVIANTRGIGYSVCEGGRKKVLQMNRTEFMENTLPEIFMQMSSLGISIKQFIDRHDSFESKIKS